MDQGFKHFSHTHNLLMHEMPEGIEVSCSSCHSTATRTVYVCWQCNFFLHDQCYRATRSLRHPSHPPHPLTLVPYPTYQSNSFYCNSCQMIGTGSSYTCAECEFDLHVHCAYHPIPTSSHNSSAQNPSKEHTTSHDPSVPQNGTHSGGVDREEGERESIPDPQAQLQLLQLQMQMAKQQAQFMASCGASLASLA